MSISPLPAAFRTALREELVRQVLDDTMPPRDSRWWSRRRRAWWGAGVVLAIGVGGGSVALAMDGLPQPGADQVTLQAAPVTGFHIGSATVELGDRPAGSTDVEISFTCLSGGIFAFPDGTSTTCTPWRPGDTAAGRTTISSLTLPKSRSTLTITAPPGARWSLVATYSRHRPTGWAINDNGTTYGVPNDEHGDPDLIAVIATNHREGYVYAAQLNDQPHFTSPADAVAWQKRHAGEDRAVAVYTSDGHTVIGKFVIAAEPARRQPRPRP